MDTSLPSSGISSSPAGRRDTRAADAARTPKVPDDHHVHTEVAG
jgi:hypothetical protein